MIGDDPIKGISADALLLRAVRNARAPQINRGRLHSRWVAVMTFFDITPAQSRGLCEWAELDPDEQVKR